MNNKEFYKELFDFLSKGTTLDTNKMFSEVERREDGGLLKKLPIDDFKETANRMLNIHNTGEGKRGKE